MNKAQQDCVVGLIRAADELAAAAGLTVVHTSITESGSAHVVTFKIADVDGQRSPTSARVSA